MFKAIEKIKTNGYVPNTILDLGAHHGNWTIDCLNIFPDAKYYLFEPIEYSELNRFKQFPAKFKIFNKILNKESTLVDWYELKNTGDSMFKEKTKHFIDCKPQKKLSYTLDSILENEINTQSTIFMKIDCQGAEIPILEGAKNILTQTDFILLECPLFGEYNENVPCFNSHIKKLDDFGFRLYDITDVHYVNNFPLQVDLVFISKQHYFHQAVQEKILK
jgi:FkbM family methyltransferase